MPARIQIRHGSKLPPEARSVAQGTAFANPFVTGAEYHTGHALRPCIEAALRDIALGAVSDGMLTLPEVRTIPDEATAVKAFDRWVPDQVALLERAVTELAGRDLGCWCAVGEPCHGDTWLSILNPPPPEPEPQVLIGRLRDLLADFDGLVDRRAREVAADLALEAVAQARAHTDALYRELVASGQEAAALRRQVGARDEILAAFATDLGTALGKEDTDLSLRALVGHITGLVRERDSLRERFGAPETHPRRDQHLEVRAARWFSPSPAAAGGSGLPGLGTEAGIIGVVLQFDTITERYRAFIGVGHGLDRDDDELLIAEYGADFDACQPGVGAALFPGLDGKWAGGEP